MAATILLLGSNGQLGRQLQAPLAALGRLVAAGRGQADLRQPKALRALLRELRPAVIVNAAAYTAVDRAEAEPELAHAVNAVAPRVLAEEAGALGALLVHYSTDYVFDGAKRAPYVETDAAAPLSAYGRSKLAGEQAIRAAQCRHLILRCGWLHSAHGGNFARTVLALAAQRDSLQVVDDQVGTPTSAALVAGTTCGILAAQLSGRAHRDMEGTYHLAASGQASWFEYARFVVELAQSAGSQLRLRPDAIRAVSSAEYASPARRPPDSRLDCAKLCKTFSLQLPDWRQGVRDTVAQLCGAKPGFTSEFQRHEYR